MSCFNRTVDGQPMPKVEEAEDREMLFLALPEDWRQFHRDNVAKLDQGKVAGACAFLRRMLCAMEPEELDGLVASMKANPEWFTEHHFFGMMQVRNELRANGFGEKDFGIDNLDDYAVGLVERAFGI